MANSRTRKKKFNELVDKFRTFIYVCTIVAAIVIVFAERELFYGAFVRAAPKAPPASAASHSVTAPASSPMLSIDNIAALPTTTIAEGDIVPFSFTIHNTGAAQQFWYKVSVKFSTGEADVIDENVIQMASGASQSIPESLKFETSPETAQITIQLEGTSQSITFTLPRQ